MISSRLAYKLTLFFASLGLGLSLYLWYMYSFSLPLPCTISHGCDLVRQSKYAYFFGIPMPAMGAAFYISLIMLSTYLLKKYDKRIFILLKIMGAWGFIFSAYLTYLEIYVIKAICSWCVLSALLATGIFVILNIPSKEKV